MLNRRTLTRRGAVIGGALALTVGLAGCAAGDADAGSDSGDMGTITLGYIPSWTDGLSTADLLEDQLTKLGYTVEMETLTEAAPLPGRTSETILTEAERHLQGLDARLVFSAKESLFKALYPEVGGFFGFDAAVVSPILSEGSFEIRLTRDLGGSSSGTVYTGRAAHADGVLVTLLAL